MERPALCRRGTLRPRRPWLRAAAAAAAAAVLALAARPCERPLGAARAGAAAPAFVAAAARRQARAPAAARAAEAEAAARGAADEPKTPLAELQVGQTLEGVVTNRWRTVGCFVDVGAERAGLLEVGEFRDGFPTEGNNYKRGDKVQVRVLDVSDGQLCLSLRSGDLARPPRRPKGPPADVTPLEGVSPDEWLEGEITSLTTWGAFVAVPPPSGGDPVIGMLHKSYFRDGFTDDAVKAVRGGRVKVRVLSMSVADKKVTLSMLDP
uniref:S1 motif domain-containing protein n=1 Tax=Alexandrium monilatum TaxID=311494 RepID=A0A7S4SG78_9DINO